MNKITNSEQYAAIKMLLNVILFFEINSSFDIFNRCSKAFFLSQFHVDKHLFSYTHHRLKDPLKQAKPVFLLDEILCTRCENNIKNI